MIKLYENIKLRRLALGMTQAELAELLGYADKGMISRIESGQVDLSQSKILAFAQALKVTPSVLMGWEEDEPVSQLVAEGQLEPVKRVSFPILGAVSCGEPKFAESDYTGTVYADEDVDADFCLRAKGDSMINAGIEDGNIVFIKRQQTVQNGEIAVVAIGDEALLKRVYWYPDKQLLILRPENPAYEDLLYSAEAAEEIRILGKAVFLQKRIR